MGFELYIQYHKTYCISYILFHDRIRTVSAVVQRVGKSRSAFKRDQPNEQATLSTVGDRGISVLNNCLECTSSFNTDQGSPSFV